MDASTLEKDDVVYYAAVSADGYIATPDGGVGWLESYFIPELGFNDFIARVGGVIMGRTTYDGIAVHGKWPYRGKPGVVLTHRPLDGLDAPVAAVDGTPGEALAAVRANGPGPYWIVGGADAAAQFLQSGAMTRADMFVIPELLGSGIPAFRNDTVTGLDLIGTQTYPNSVVRLSYRPRAGR